MQTHRGIAYQFGPFEVNADSGQLLRNGRPVRIQEQPFRLLVVLLENAGEPVSREELRRRLWQDDTFVDFDGSLRVAVRKLREALDDAADDPRYIETIPKRGYRFLVPDLRRLETSAPADLAQAPAPAQPAPPLPAPPEPLAASTGRRNLRLTYGIAAAALLLLATAATIFFLQRRNQARPLTDRDILVLADFTNTSGDPVFDGTLRQALAIQLEQSPFLKIMDDEKVQQTLRLMNLAPAQRITNQIAQDICVRNASAATIDGSIDSLGKNYVITLQAITCSGGATLAREQVQAHDKEHVLKALGTAAAALRGRLGESLSSIQKLNRPLEEGTTSSLEALKSCTTGLNELKLGHFLAARASLEQATALDPNFALAWYYLSLSYNNAGDTAKEFEYKDKAFALIDRVSEFERYFIAGGYFESTGELDRAIEVYRLGGENYPRYWGFQNLASENYINLGEIEEGLQTGHISNQLLPETEPPYRRLLDSYLILDRPDEARQVAETLRQRGIGGARIHQRFLEMAYLADDAPAIATETQWFAGKPEEYLSFGLQAAHLNILGQRRASSALYKRAAEAALRPGLRNVAADLDAADDRADALAGSCATVRRLQRSALALALCGDAAGAERLAAETSRRLPKGTIWNAVQLPEIRAAIEMQRGHPAAAVELLAGATPYERAYPEAIYLRGLAYLRLHKGAEAAAEFQKIVDHKGASWAATWRSPNWGLCYSIAHLGLARALVLSGDHAKANQSYQNFFALWKDADPTLPLLLEAKKEYASRPQLSGS